MMHEGFMEALNLWAGMCNKADKERFDLLLENAMLKQDSKN